MTLSIDEPERTVSVVAPIRRNRPVSAQYAEGYGVFAWSYAVDASPRPSKARWRSTRRGAYGFDGLKHLMKGVVRDLSAQEGRTIYYCFVPETGSTGYKHIHCLLGRIGRLEPAQIASVFAANGFGSANVKLWDATKHNDYYFKSLNPWAAGYADAEHESNVRWNRSCKQSMILSRKHLELRLGTGQPPTPAEQLLENARLAADDWRIVKSLAAIRTRRSHRLGHAPHIT